MLSVLSVYLQQESKPKPKAVSASSWYRCSNLAHSKDIPLRLPLPSITFFFTILQPFYRFSQKLLFPPYRQNTRNDLQDRSNLAKMGGGCFSFCTQQGAGQRNSCTSIKFRNVKISITQIYRL
jgi:hypothetical protein